ncbi:thiamine phosphate synthase [Desertifilum sp. FACHB-1129]|uniref:Thiamine-phosphate synthase n=1 Tax=Desertifilum tharense IPPAS B-1220 TaxID=1781255 RepID=A0A1E5QEB5_9CYAN|nr:MULTISPECIES: thiamine phosphate synthase [Desertifilum]MDA0211960.1 thiamine phosphate synthase [Cyanobacteria bacterium FC1]MBD2313314.1 thiamine phosphate synthase [Desertifilum sp. FACHB-1129]MBD2324225.1 thiamine phosphate synthase [Desertifilum sp. FACHB-866]MBD2334239.1 thiamine phosphate synthase [Desertifilum sp. FACHB-868]OEJ72951.1 thiamine-phosphate diphosphorylase [Desertifilum tharense IPPAS B-1220]
MGDIYEQSRAFQPTVHRILDANLDRAREGLRIIEEWCRFGLNSEGLTNECKQLRQALAVWHTPEIRAARNTAGDPGTELTHPQEKERSSIGQLLQVNLCRVEEALRVLEEYGKLHHAKMGEACKQMRYRVYLLETNLMAYQRRQRLRDSTLYLITSPSDRLLTVVEAALQGGLTLVQYRSKTADDLVRLEEAQKLRSLCDRYGALLIVNDRVDIALAVDADGVHLGQQDIPIGLARQLLGPQRLIGRSTTNPEEMQRAIAEGADYIGVGPVYATPTKADKAAAGLEYVRYAAEKASVPWFAIGGIDLENLNQVLDAGATRISVVRAVMQAEQPTLTTQYFLSQLTRMQTMRSLHP